MIHRSVLPLFVLAMALGLQGCEALGGGEAAPAGDKQSGAADPVVARALHDPLMSDPDLARRSEANAALALADSGALPVFTATPEASTRAREAARSQLLEGGAIPALSPLSPGPGGAALGEAASLAALITAAGVPDTCRAGVRPGFDWAARLSAPAAIMPLGMVDEAAGSDAPACRVRAVRYQTAAGVEDALAWHDALAQRAGLAITRHAAPEAMLIAKGKRGEALQVRVRPLPTGMSAVDLVLVINP